MPSPNRTVHFVHANSLHALRFRCECLIAHRYYGVCACTGITVKLHVCVENQKEASDFEAATSFISYYLII